MKTRQENTGELTIGESIYYNYPEGCLLRIGGFTEQQKEEMKTATFIDIILCENGKFVVNMAQKPGFVVKKVVKKAHPKLIVKKVILI
jgi:hypothetical protein